MLEQSTITAFIRDYFCRVDSNAMKFSLEDTDRIIMMAWEDRTPFEAIRSQFGLSEAEVRTFMRQVQSKKTYIRWRERVEGRVTKLGKLRDGAVTRHKSKNQKF